MNIRTSRQSVDVPEFPPGGVEPVAARRIAALLADHRTPPNFATAPRIEHDHIVPDERDP